MTITVLATITFEDGQNEALTTYLEVTAPLLERAKAQVMQMFDLKEAIVGNGPAKRLIVVEYPDRASVDLVFNSPEYKAIIPIRDKAFSTYEVTIADQLSSAPLSTEEEAR